MPYLNFEYTKALTLHWGKSGRWYRSCNWGTHKFPLVFSSVREVCMYMHIGHSSKAQQKFRVNLCLLTIVIKSRPHLSKYIVISEEQEGAVHQHKWRQILSKTDKHETFSWTRGASLNTPHKAEVLRSNKSEKFLAKNSFCDCILSQKGWNSHYIQYYWMDSENYLCTID